MEASFIYVDTDLALQKAANEWSELHTLGIDIECENNLHHYGMYIALFQISSGKKHWIVDALTIKNFSPLIKVLENPFIQKIFHDITFDASAIYQQLKSRPRNVFDTQIAALLLGYEGVGLGTLMEDKFHEKKECKFQMADWTKRPLTHEMLQYAAKDAVFLIKLRNLFIEELRKKGRLQWANEEFLFLETKDPNHKQMTFLDLRGVKQLSDQQRALLKRFFAIRERIAKKVDKPIHFIISNKRMIELISNPPKSFQQWKAIKGVHPMVRNKSAWFIEALMKSRSEGVTLPPREIKRMNSYQRKKVEQLDAVRTTISEKLNIQRYLIMSKDQMNDIATSDSFIALRPWQRKLVMDELMESHSNLFK